MKQSPIEALRLRLEDQRLQQHFRRVEGILRARDVSHLPHALQAARERYLDRLHAYAVRGIFPRNHERPYYAPCFIDRDGHECAVAHLMMSSGQHDAAVKIATVANYAYVPEMKFSELDNWAQQTGLSGEELALIQPSYYPGFISLFIWPALAIWVPGFISFVINVIQLARKRIGKFMPKVGLVWAVASVGVMGICLLQIAILSYNPDAPLDLYNRVGYQRDCFVAAVISLMIAVLSGGIGLYRRRMFERAKAQGGAL